MLEKSRVLELELVEAKLLSDEHRIRCLESNAEETSAAVEALHARLERVVDVVRKYLTSSK